jgi:hypothetical protein
MGGYVTYGAGSSATFNTYWYLSGPVVTVGTSAVNFVRAGSASQLKSVKYVAIANLTSTATTANSLTITTGQSIDQRAVNSTDMPLGTRILLTAQTTTTQNGIYEVTTAGTAPVLTRVLGMNQVSATSTGTWNTGSGVIPYGLFVQVIPGLWAGASLACTRNYSAYVLSVAVTIVGTNAFTFVNCCGPNGYVPPAGARIRVPNIYCGIGKSTINYVQTAYLGAGQRLEYHATIGSLEQGQNSLGQQGSSMQVGCRVSLPTGGTVRRLVFCRLTRSRLFVAGD